MRCFLSSLLLLTWSSMLWSQPSIILEHQFDQTDLTPYCHILQIPDTTARPQEIARLDHESNFENLLIKYPRFPHAKCSYWLTFSIENNSAFQRVFLIAANYGLYDIRLYQRSGDSLALLEATGYGAHRKPEWDDLFYTFEINTGKTGTENRYYLLLWQIQPPIVLL